MITPTNIDRLLVEYPIQCFKCGKQIGESKLDNCRSCGFSNEESLVQWICEREEIPTIEREKHG